MKIQLRQICLVAHELKPVIEDLTQILGIQACYVDPGVAKFGLENTLMPIGHNFLEVVAPVEEGTAGGRYLMRRKGDGGYMVITQADSQATFEQVRENAFNNEVRIAFESRSEDWHLCQLHPADMIAAFLEIECDAQNDFNGYWHPVGGDGWQDKVKQDVTVDWRGVELQSDDPQALAELWSAVSGMPLAADSESPVLHFNNAYVRFTQATDGRGPGLSAIHLLVRDRAYIVAQARMRDCFVDDHLIEIGGVRWHLLDA